MATTNRTTGAKTNLQKAAQAVGAVFLLVGVLGFIPGITTNYDALSFAGHGSEALLGVEAAAREYNQAGHRLDKTVAAAKAAGASWADIGRAVGISRQSAHERWADKQ